METREILDERQNTHGSFEDNARISQSLKQIIKQSRNYGLLDEVQREAIDMICLKLSRICSGDPYTHLHAEDIAGYAQLVVDHLTDDGDSSSPDDLI